MSRMGIYAGSVKEAVQQITPYLEDTSNTAHKVIRFDGWYGIAASAVLRAIAEDPPPSLRKKFDKIVHIDCSRWKSRRVLQRAIAEELRIPPWVIAASGRQDEEDDFRGVDEGSRAEVADLTREIFQTVRNLSCLVIFHNGSDTPVDLAEFGFPQFNWFSPNTLLWTFRGRLRLNPKLEKRRYDSSQLYVSANRGYPPRVHHNGLVLEEAREVVQYTQHKQSMDPEIAAKCLWYLLWLEQEGGGIMDYDWATHTSNYWVCDGIVQEGQTDELAWEVSAALHQELRMEDFSTGGLRLDYDADAHTADRWKSVAQWEKTYIETAELTSFFLAAKSGLYPELPRDMFQRSERLLRVLKLSGCIFSFYSPPFHCCRSLRFLGLDRCKDRGQEEDEVKQGRPEMEFFKSLWVLHIRHTDWELDLSSDIIEPMAANIRDAHIEEGMMWGNNFAWRRLHNLRKLRVIRPTRSWVTSKNDEFTDMMKLELLDLSGNDTLEVLPSLSSATCLKTLVLDGCLRLAHVGPQGLPPSLESFSFSAGPDEAEISRITLAGCANLVDFRLCGTFPNLEELDLSRTAVKVLNLTEVVGEEPLRGKILLMGCEQLRSIVWPKEGTMEELRLLCIDTRGGETVREASQDSWVSWGQQRYCRASVCTTDMRFLQSLVLWPPGEHWPEHFCWGSAPCKLNLCLTSSKEGGKKGNDKETTVGILGQSPAGSPPLHKSLTYDDVSIGQIATEIDGGGGGGGTTQFQPLDLHVEIGEGISDVTNVVSEQGIRAIAFVMNRVQSLHVHDSTVITAVGIPVSSTVHRHYVQWNALKWCRVERCPRLDTVFSAYYRHYDRTTYFEQMETFWASHLLVARSIWMHPENTPASLANLRAVHLHWCPRLTFVLPVRRRGFTLPSLETLHVVHCGDLRHVFPGHYPDQMLEFPKLKDLYLHELPKLQQICETRMFAPELQTIFLRGCWSLRRLPATDGRRRHDGRRVVVDCEKDWWGKLEWDGLDAGHDPSLFAPRHSAYYKKRMLRSTVLR